MDFWETTSFYTIIMLCVLHCLLDFLYLILCTASTCNILKCMFWSLSLGDSLLLQVGMVAVLPPTSVETVQSPALVHDFLVGRPRYNQTSTRREICFQQGSYPSIILHSPLCHVCFHFIYSCSNMCPWLQFSFLVCVHSPNVSVPVLQLEF